MELDYKLNKNQQQLVEGFMKTLGKQYSWLIRRFQGTGVRYWEITIYDGPEWSGISNHSVQAKRLKPALDLAVQWALHERKQ